MIALTGSDDTLWAYDGLLGGTMQGMTNLNLKNQTIDALDGNDVARFDYLYTEVVAERWFTLTVAATGVVTLTNASGGITFDNFELYRYKDVSMAVGSAGDDALATPGSNTNDPGLFGLGGNDTLNGGSGNDIMLGGSGNDTYVVDSSGDSVRERTTLADTADAGGIDLVQAAIDYILGDGIENLALTGSAVNGTGNALANALTGTATSNRLDGGAGADTLAGGGATDADTLIGGSGDDLYLVDSAGDRVQEATTAGGATDAGGTDTVRSALSWTLSAFVENLELTGTARRNLNGNELANTLAGNLKANRLQGEGGNDTLRGGDGGDSLNGGAGNDLMQGGAGSDKYVVDSALDVVSEETSQGSGVNAGGSDTVSSPLAWTLGSFVENLVLTGTDAVNGTGNSLPNLLTGNRAANLLVGAEGSDTLDGGSGNDTLQGGAATDTFVFTSALAANANVDLVADYDTGGKADAIALDDAVFLALGTVTGPTALAAGAFRAGTAATTPDEHIVYDRTIGALYYDADGSGPLAQVRFATLGADTHPGVDASDFTVI